MNDNPIRFTRRSVAIGGGVAVALGLGALGMSLPKWLRKSYPATAYDDLLDQLEERDAAKIVGLAVIGTSTFDSEGTAEDLRKHIADRTLKDVANADSADGRLIDAKGWLLPETVGLLCALAAQPA